MLVLRCPNKMVVSIICFSSLFVPFRTVEYVESAKAFYLLHHSLEKKVPMEKESSHSVGGTSTFIALFPHIYIIGVGNILSRSCTKSVTVYL